MQIVLPFSKKALKIDQKVNGHCSTPPAGSKDSFAAVCSGFLPGFSARFSAGIRLVIDALLQTDISSQSRSG
jgi:hypothetical protein